MITAVFFPHKTVCQFTCTEQREPRKIEWGSQVSRELCILSM